MTQIDIDCKKADNEKSKVELKRKKTKNKKQKLSEREICQWGLMKNAFFYWKFFH